MDYRHPKVLVVDNYDSFTYNLVQILEKCNKGHFEVMRNDRVDPVTAGQFDGFLFSPGPGRPTEAPIMAELLRLYQDRKSFLGVCLGHQAIAEAYGMQLINLPTVRHGLKMRIRIDDPSDYLFKGLPLEFEAGLYHSWAVRDEDNSLRPTREIRVTARSQDGLIMAISHVRYDIKGVQFHPESYLTDYGSVIIKNWIENLITIG